MLDLPQVQWTNVPTGYLTQIGEEKYIAIDKFLDWVKLLLFFYLFLLLLINYYNQNYYYYPVNNFTYESYCDNWVKLGTVF